MKNIYCTIFFALFFAGCASGKLSLDRGDIRFAIPFDTFGGTKPTIPDENEKHRLSIPSTDSGSLEESRAKSRDNPEQASDFKPRRVEGVDFPQPQQQEEVLREEIIAEQMQQVEKHKAQEGAGTQK